MKGSFATRLKDPSFMTAFNALFDRFASEQVVTLMKGSFATRLKDPSFMTAFNAFINSVMGQTVASQSISQVVGKLPGGLRPLPRVPPGHRAPGGLRPVPQVRRCGASTADWRVDGVTGKDRVTPGVIP